MPGLPEDSPPPRERPGLRVLLHARPDSTVHPGGDMVVLDRLKDGLERLGCRVDVSLDPTTDPAAYDIVHLFNLAFLKQAAHIEACARLALERGVPYVVTALVEDQPRYLGRALATYRSVLGYLDAGQPPGRLPDYLRLAKEAPAIGGGFLNVVAENAARILVSGSEEAATVNRVHPGAKTALTHFGSAVMEAEVGPELFDQYGVRDFVLCVARLEVRKNQLMLMAALEDEEVPLVFVGGDFSYQPEYVQQCRRFKRRGPTLFLGRVAPEVLQAAYRAAKVHCLPSWYELPGLVTLEAARYGTAVVASRWGTIEDYLGDEVLYVEPDDLNGLRHVIWQAMAAGPRPEAARRAAGWTWERHAGEVLAVYETVIGETARPKRRRAARIAGTETGRPPQPGPPPDPMNPVDQISFILASSRPERLTRTRSALARLGAQDIVAIANPRSIFEAYDRGWRQARRDALCFVHDDVDVKGLDAAMILERLADPGTGFLGVAGSRILDQSGVWWQGLSTPDQARRLSGRCGHRQGEREWLSEYGAFGQVVVLDGVCLFTTRAVLEAIGGFADPPLSGFDFYDISATLRAHLAGYANHTVPVDLFHWGMGTMRPGWDLNRQAFVAKYAARLPCALPGLSEAAPEAATHAASQPSTSMAAHRSFNMDQPNLTTTPATAGAGAAQLTMVSDESRQEPWFELFTSRQFVSWMAEQNISLALTTYQAGKLFLLGTQADGKVSVCERTFNRCMGLWGDGQSLWMSTLYQLWRFENALPPGQLTGDGFDRLYVPQMAYTTGDIDIHDLAVEKDGRVVFVNTLFGCLATPDDTHSFAPLWQPPFLSRLAAEDRCHMNGLALRDGQVAFVTCVSQSDVADGWRDRRRDSGVVVDVRANQVVAKGLSMPHSPRWYQGKLWLLNSGTGELGTVDLEEGRFEPLVFCPGYLRGLAFVGDYAVIGSSKARENRTFQGLALDENLKARDADPRCGLYVIDLRSGDIVHWVRVEGIIDELYDVVVLPGVRRPKALGLKSDEIRRTLTLGEGGRL